MTFKRFDLLHSFFGNREVTALFILQGRRIELLVLAHHDETVEGVDHQCEVFFAVQLLNQLFEVDDAVAKVVGVCDSMLVILSDQVRSMCECDDCLDEFRLQFWLLWVVMELDETLVDERAHPQGDDSDCIVEHLVVVLSSILHRDIRQVGAKLVGFPREVPGC